MNTNKIVWPVSVRIIHWVLAAIILLDMFILEEGDPPHRYLGYFALVLIATRFYYGVKEKGALSFSDFTLNPRKILAFLKNHFSRNLVEYEGHNPVALIVYFLMWFAVIALAMTGWMLGLEAFWGDETIEKIHGCISNFLGILIIIHFVGIILDSFLHKRKTWMGMIDGKKR